MRPTLRGYLLRSGVLWDTISFSTTSPWRYHCPNSVSLAACRVGCHCKVLPKAILDLTVDVLVIIRKIGPTLTSLSLDFSCHFADDLDSTNVHLCAEIRDSCQNLEYLTLSFPPSDNLHDAPRPNVCHQLFRAPTNLLTRGPGMRNLKKAEILGYHGYCEGSSRKMVIEASEEVWATQRQSWEPGEPEIGSAHECLHTNIQIHGTPAGKASLLNCRELRGISGTLPQLRSGCSKEQKAHVGTVYESSSIWDLILISPIRTLDQGCYRRRSPRRQNGKK